MLRKMKKVLSFVLAAAMLVAFSPEGIPPVSAAESGWKIVYKQDAALDSVCFYDVDTSEGIGYFYGYIGGKVAVMDESYNLVKQTSYTGIVSDRYAEVDGEPVVLIEKNGSYGLMSAAGEEIVRPVHEFLDVLENYYVQESDSTDGEVPTYDLQGDSFDNFDADEVDWGEYDTDEFLFLRNVDTTGTGETKNLLYDWTTETSFKTIPTFDEGSSWDDGKDGVYYVGSYGDYSVLRYEKYYRNYGAIQNSETHNEYIIYNMDKGEVEYDSGQDGFVWADETTEQLVVMEDKTTSVTTSAPTTTTTTSAPSVPSATEAAGSTGDGTGSVVDTAAPAGETTQAPADTTGNGQSATAVPTAKASTVTTSTPSTTPAVTTKPTSTPKKTTSPSTSTTTKSTSSAKVGKIFPHKASNGRYKITKATGNRTVTYLSPLKKGKSTIKIPAKVTYKGKTYKVTKVAKKALYGNKNLVYLELGKNIRSIGARAFANCTSLRYIMVKTNKIAESAVGYHAFYGDSSRIRVKTSPERWRRYARAFMREGLPNGVIFVIEPVPLVR